MSTEKPTCNLLENNNQVYVPDALSYIGTAAANTAAKSAAWSSFLSLCSTAIIISIPLGMSVSQSGFNATTIVLMIILLSIISSMSSTYNTKEQTPDGYTTDCIKVENIDTLAKVNY